MITGRIGAGRVGRVGSVAIGSVAIRSVLIRSVLIRSVLVSSLMVGALSGCAMIPGSGPVLAGSVVDDDPGQGPPSQVLPEEPRPHASAAGIVTGFIRAASGFSDHHQVARDYLTPQKRLAWRPDTTVEVYPRESSVVLIQAGKPNTPLTAASLLTATPGPPPPGDGHEYPETAIVTVQTPIEAQIDADSRYHLSTPGQTVTRTFGLIRVGGEWRISTLDDGILVSALDFSATFRPFPVYFTDPSGRYLVPDLHWFADTRDPGSPELPTALVRVLLEGPPPWLKGAVVSGAPPGTAMAVDAVVVSADSVATVDLNQAVLRASTSQRRLLISQLQATLRQLSGIDSVQITVQRLAFDVPSGSSGSSGSGDPSQADVQPIVDPVVDGDPVVIDPKGHLARLAILNRTLETVKDVAGLAVPGANRPAVSMDSSAYAVLNANRSQLLLQLPGTTAVALVTSAGLSAPSFDPYGWVWTSPAANPGWVFVARTDSGAVKVKAPWLKGDVVVGLRIARDGTRAVIAAQTHGQARLFLAGVIRDDQGIPQSLTQPLRLLPDLAKVEDVAWVDQVHVVVLGSRNSAPSAGVVPWVAQIGGGAQPSTAVAGAESITAGEGVSSLMAGTAKGTQARSGALWEQISTGRWPAFPG